MSARPPFHLTTRDLGILEALLEREGHADEAYRLLLRRKLSHASIVFAEGISPEIATIDSRIEFTVDGQRTARRVLVRGADGALPGLSLPVTTLRGIALLGLTEGATVTVEHADGRREVLRLDRVLYQPEAQRRQTQAAAAPDGARSVLPFPTRAAPAQAAMPAAPDDDDPGPQAA